ENRDGAGSHAGEAIDDSAGEVGGDIGVADLIRDGTAGGAATAVVAFEGGEGAAVERADGQGCGQRGGATAGRERAGAEQIVRRSAAEADGAEANALEARHD